MVFNPVQPTGAGLGWERGMDRGAMRLVFQYRREK